MEESLGTIFKRYREEAFITLEQVERDLKISKRNLLALEFGDYAKLPEELYTRNYIRSYALYLGLDVDRLMRLYETEREAFCDLHTSQRPHVYQAGPKVIITPKTIKIGLGLLAALMVVSYLIFQIHNIFQPPRLTVTEPEEHMKTDQRVITLKGETEREARVFINRKEIFPDPSGAFQTTIDLQPGLNVLTVSSAKKHSKESVVYREILVTE